MSIKWYDKLRTQYRPVRLRYLLVAESPPDPLSGERRFFYSPKLTYDNLFRGVAMAVYGERVNMYDKTSVLEKLRDDGYWLIDAVDHPINRSPIRKKAVRDAIPGLVSRCKQLRPENGIIICHDKVYSAAEDQLRDAGMRILHDNSLPFPLGNHRARFIRGFRHAIQAGNNSRA